MKERDMKSIIYSAVIAASTCSFADTIVVTTDGYTFNPSEIEVMVGDIVHWEWAGGVHTVTSGSGCTADGLFDSALDSGTPSFEWTVPEGADSTIGYFCDPHCGFGMTGVINVATASANVFNVNMVHASGGSFTWAEKGSGVNGYIFEPDCDSNIFQMTFEVTGSIDIEIVANYGLAVHAIHGGPAPTLAIGDVTFPEGFYVLSYDGTAAPGFEFITPGASAFSSSADPLWLEIGSTNADVHWQHRNNQVVYEFTGGGVGSAVYGNLVNSTGYVSEQEGYWYGGVTPYDITLPAEAELGLLAIDAGYSYIYCGDQFPSGYSEDPYRVIFVFGEEEAEPLPEDINGDGVVDLDDLLELIAAWGSTSP